MVEVRQFSDHRAPNGGHGAPVDATLVVTRNGQEQRFPIRVSATTQYGPTPITVR